MSKRGAQWEDFRFVVAGHVDNYTIPQYGDFPDDEVAQNWDAAQCVDAISKYVTRYRIMRRGRLETLRDMAKIAHFACMAFYMMNPTQEEIDKIMEGKV